MESILDKLGELLPDVSQLLRLRGLDDLIVLFKEDTVDGDIGVLPSLTIVGKFLLMERFLTNTFVGIGMVPIFPDTLILLRERESSESLLLTEIFPLSTELTLIRPATGRLRGGGVLDGRIGTVTGEASSM